MENPDFHGNFSDKTSVHISTILSLLYGAFAGLIATWAISTAIAASELVLGLRISTFYSIMGIAIGSDDPIAAAYLGFGMHILTGTVAGGIIGALAVKIERLRRSDMANIFDPYRAILMGLGTGFLVWVVLFLPVTAFLVQPSETRIAAILSHEQNNLSAFDIHQSFTGIAFSAILFHVIWGTMFGFIISSLLRIRILSLSESSSSMPQQYRQPAGRSMKIALFGLAAGLIASLAISGLVLLAEKISSLPVGTFYYVLVSALTNSYSGNIQGAVALGLLTHLVAGSLMGLIMSVPFILFKETKGGSTRRAGAFFQKYSPVYGLAFGFGLWLVVFIPIAYAVVVPLLNSFEDRDVLIGQRVPTGELSGVTFFNLLSMLDRIIFGAIGFNIFYGLLAAIMIQSFTEKFLTSGKNRQRAQLPSGGLK